MPSIARLTAQWPNLKTSLPTIAYGTLRVYGPKPLSQAGHVIAMKVRTNYVRRSNLNVGQSKSNARKPDILLHRIELTSLAVPSRRAALGHVDLTVDHLVF